MQEVMLISVDSLKGYSTYIFLTAYKVPLLFPTQPIQYDHFGLFQIYPIQANHI